ncbi:MAG: hypothetical protein SNG14_04450 [Rikenellaceae bacterium]
MCGSTHLYPYGHGLSPRHSDGDILGSDLKMITLDLGSNVTFNKVLCGEASRCNNIEAFEVQTLVAGRHKFTDQQIMTMYIYCTTCEKLLTIVLL